MSTVSKRNGATTTLGLLALVAVIGIIIFIFATAPDNRTTGDKIGDAVDELPNVGKAADQLQDKTPAEKLDDAVEDIGDKMKE
jgi:peptidoglycan hydrolase CwlO-like protein